MTYTDEMLATAYGSGAFWVEPWSDDQVNPASYDLRLGKELRVRPSYGEALDGEWSAVPLDLALLNEHGEYLEPRRMEHAYVMEPGEFLLASTEETVYLDPTLVGRVEGKSSLARVGLAVHVTGGFIDPGFRGQITLEMANLLHRPLVLRPGMRIAQIAISNVFGRVAKPYAKTGHYQGQAGPTLSRYKIDL